MICLRGMQAVRNTSSHMHRCMASERRSSMQAVRSVSSHMPQPTILLLAAGLSSRMGVWKPALPWQGVPLIQFTLQRLHSLPHPIVVVGGHRFLELEALVHEVAQQFANSKVRCVYNGHYKKGFVTSVQRGLQEVEAEDFFMLPADMPAVPLELFAELPQAIGVEPSIALKNSDTAPPCGTAPPLVGPSIARPVYKGVPGHPVFCKNTVKQHIMALPAGESVRNGLAGFSVATVSSSWRCVFDIDTPEDIQDS